jgi:hypothetical protein
MPDDEPILKSDLQELKDFMKVTTLTNEIRSINHHIEGANKRVATLSGMVQQLEIAPSKADENKEDDAKDKDDVVYGIDERLTNENRLHRRLHKNKIGMGGNINRQNQGNDPYAKLKFTIPPFHGRYDAEEYLDWEMTVEQKFKSHLVPACHKVRQTTNEFKDFTVI